MGLAVAACYTKIRVELPNLMLALTTACEYGARGTAQAKHAKDAKAVGNESSPVDLSVVVGHVVHAGFRCFAARAWGKRQSASAVHPGQHVVSRWQSSADDLPPQEYDR